MLFEALVLQLASHMPVHTVSRIVGESDYKIWTLLARYVARALDYNDYSDIEGVGMDETGKRKGHDYITLFVDLVKRRTLFIAEGKDHRTVKAFVDDLVAHNGKAESVREVSCDMSPAFIKGVGDHLPEAKITFDRFHIMKVINKAVDTVRKEESQTQDVLKGTKYVFLKNEENLTKMQSEKRLELTMSHRNLKSMKALHIRENFQEIYKSQTPSEFEQRLKQWYFWATHSRMEPIVKAAYTIRAHWEGVLQWKRTHIDT